MGTIGEWTTTYLHFVMQMYGHFLEKQSAVEAFGLFTAYLPLFYITVRPLWNSATGDEQYGFFEKLFMTAILAYMATLAVWFFRGMGKLEVSAAYFWMGWFLAAGGALAYSVKTGIIARGIDRSGLE